jgi:hypothetical protein
MEDIYFPLGSHSNVTEKFSFGEAFKDFSDVLLKIERPFHSRPIRKLLNVDINTFSELQKSCKLVLNSVVIKIFNFLVTKKTH